MTSNPIAGKEEERGGAPNPQPSLCPVSSDSANEMGTNSPTLTRIVAAVLEFPAISGPRKSSSILKPE